MFKSLPNALFVGAFVIGAVLVSQRTVRAASTDTESANATATIIQSIAITKTRDLDFGEAAPGDPAKIVAPADGTSAEFDVTGEPNHAFSITLPASATMLRSGGTPGTPEDEILVNTFTSSPASPSALTGAGTRTLNVGATRAAILGAQNTGSYSVSFDVTVTYQ
jgi:hypothetical protein